MDFDILAKTLKDGAVPSQPPVLSSAGLKPPVNPLTKVANSDDHKARMDTAGAAPVQEKMYTVPGQELAKWVTRQYEAARSNRDMSGASEEIRKCLRLRRGQYTVEETSMLGGEQTAVWFPLTERLCRTATSFLRNVLNIGEHRLFDLVPTPIPDVPQEIKDAATDQIVDGLLALAAQGQVTDVTPESLAELTSTMREHMITQIREQAANAARRHIDVIDDQLIASKWGEVFEGFIEDFVTYPAAVVAGPEVTTAGFAVWEGSKLVRKPRKQLRYRNVDPMKLFPSTDSTTINDGAFIIEVREYDRNTLVDNRALPGWMAAHIDIMLAEHDRSVMEPQSSDVSVDRLKDKPHKYNDSRSYEVICFYGQIPGRFLIELGVSAEKSGAEIIKDRAYEAEVFVLKDLPIRAVLVDREHSDRPFYKASMNNRVGSFWGEAIPQTVETYQRLANAHLRTMVRNMGFSSAPIFVIDDAVASRAQGPTTDIIPGMTIRVNSLSNPSARDGGLFMHQINYQGQVYINSLNQILEYAELQTGFPRYLLGAPATGGAARTLGGLSLLQSNAAVLLKSSIKNIDNGFINPLITWLYFFNMATHEDDGIKVDSEIIVRGADYLLSKEINKARLTEAINTAMPFLQSGFVKSEGVLMLLRELFSDLGFDPDRIILDVDDAKMLESELMAALRDAGGISGFGGGGGNFNPMQQSNAGQQQPQPQPQQPQPQEIQAQ